MVNSEKEALRYFADILIKNIGGFAFSKCWIRMKRQIRMTSYGAFYVDEFGKEMRVLIENDDDLYTAIEELYTITQTQLPIHKDWNRAVFTLYPDGKVNMEYIFDAEWQAEVDADAAKINAKI